jgi:hypothetical protein
MRLTPLFQQFPKEAKMDSPETVSRGLLQYLTLSSKLQGSWDQEDLEWPLLLVGQELQSFLGTKNVQWEVPLFERIVTVLPDGLKEIKLLLQLPMSVTWADYEKVIRKALERRRDTWVVQIRFERIVEGDCLQMLHIGPHAAIPETLYKMQQYARENELTIAPSHHEIYLSDPERVAEEKLKTVLLIPIKA